MAPFGPLMIVPPKANKVVPVTSLPVTVAVLTVLRVQMTLLMAVVVLRTPSAITPATVENPAEVMLTVQSPVPLVVVLPTQPFGETMAPATEYHLGTWVRGTVESVNSVPVALLKEARSPTTEEEAAL